MDIKVSAKAACGIMEAAGLSEQAIIKGLKSLIRPDKTYDGKAIAEFIKANR